MFEFLKSKKQERRCVVVARTGSAGGGRTNFCR